MGKLQLINIILFWLFFGFLSAHLAKRKGRRSIVWFTIGLFLGVFGVLMAFLVPSKIVKSSFKAPPKMPVRSDAWIKMWYYMDSVNEQKGPLDFPDLIKIWKEKKVSDKSFVWGEGMSDWKMLAEMPEIVSEMERH